MELAKLLEDAKFHGIFIADVLGGYDVSLRSMEKTKQSSDTHEGLQRQPRCSEDLGRTMACQRAAERRKRHGSSNEEYRFRCDSVDNI